MSQFRAVGSQVRLLFQTKFPTFTPDQFRKALNILSHVVSRNPSVLVCSSASLFALGAYLFAIRVPVWTGEPATGSGEYELMRVFLPFGFFLWILALLSLLLGVVLGVRRLPAVQLRTFFQRASLIIGLTLGVLALTSTLLPWVIAERAEPLVETREGTFDVGRYHALTGMNLMIGANRIVEISLVLVGSMIGILHIPLITLLERKRTDIMLAFLFLLGGTCIIGPVGLVYADRTWWIIMHIDGPLAFATTFESLGTGMLIATSCAIGLIASGIISVIKSVRQSRLAESWDKATFQL